MIGSVDDLVAEDVVYVVLLNTVGVRCIRADSMDGKIALYIIDDVGRVIHVPLSRCWRGLEVAGRSGACGCCAFGGVLAGGCRRCRSRFSRVGNVEAFRVFVNHIADLAWEGEGWMDRVQGHIASAAGSNAERGDLSHVDPKAAVLHFFVPFDPEKLACLRACGRNDTHISLTHHDTPLGDSQSGKTV